MDLIRKWRKKDYQEFIKYLESLQDLSNKNFFEKLTTTKYKILGIKIPIQRRIAKEISKGSIEEFLKLTSNNYYEEVMIKGFVIADIKEKDILLNYLDAYVNLIDDWGICDSFCNSLKIVNTDKDFWFDYFKKYLNFNEEFKIRVCLIIFLNFYIDNEHIDELLNIIDSIRIDKYYVNMARAWLLCECFIKFRDKTLKFLLKNNLNTFTFNKTISKIRESYRVSLEDKKFLLDLKRRKNEKV